MVWMFQLKRYLDNHHPDFANLLRRLKGSNGPQAKAPVVWPPMRFEQPLFRTHPSPTYSAPLNYKEQVTGNFGVISVLKKRIDEFERVEKPEFMKFFHVMELTQMLQRVDIQDGGAILDVGCDIGQWEPYFLDLFNRKAAVIGLAIEKDVVDYMNRKNKDSMIHFIHGDAKMIPLPDNSIDLVFVSGVVQYIQELAQTLDELKRVSRKYILLGRMCLFKHSQNVKTYQGGITEIYIYNYHSLLKIFAAHGLKVVSFDYSAEWSLAEDIAEPVINGHFLLEKQ